MIVAVPTFKVKELGRYAYVLYTYIQKCTRSMWYCIPCTVVVCIHVHIPSRCILYRTEYDLGSRLTVTSVIRDDVGTSINIHAFTINMSYHTRSMRFVWYVTRRTLNTYACDAGSLSILPPNIQDKMQPQKL